MTQPRTVSGLFSTFDALFKQGYADAVVVVDGKPVVGSPEVVEHGDGWMVVLHVRPWRTLRAEARGGLDFGRSLW